MQCSECGSEAPTGKRFCSDCGSPLRSEGGEFYDQIVSIVNQQLRRRDQKTLEQQTAEAIIAG
jgi:predicted amidophosphoribosyltransferase